MTTSSGQSPRRRVRRPSRRAGAVAAAVAVIAATAGVVGSADAATPEAVAGTSSCGAWQTTTVATGLGALENLVPDGRGGFYLSGLTRNAVFHESADGTVTTVATVTSPGGLRLVGDALYVNSGDGVAANVTQQPVGRLLRMDVRTAAHTPGGHGPAGGVALRRDGQRAWRPAT